VADMGQKANYYWAQGKKISLEQAQEVAVDIAGAKKAGLWEGKLASAAAESGTQINQDLMVLPSAAMSDQLLDNLDDAGAVQPVYRHEDTLLVVLPEVRVETEDPGKAEALKSAVDRWESKVTMEQTKPGRFVLRPESHRGKDALDLANYVSETVKPEAAQARFVRMVPKEARGE
jgi:hypothetical protein